MANRNRSRRGGGQRDRDLLASQVLIEKRPRRRLPGAVFVYGFILASFFALIFGIAAASLGIGVEALLIAAVFAGILGLILLMMRGPQREGDWAWSVDQYAPEITPAGLVEALRRQKNPAKRGPAGQ